MVHGSRLTRIVRPTTAGSPPKRRRQSASASTTTRSRAASSAPEANVRPTAAGTPKTSKNGEVTSALATRSGWPPPERSMTSLRYAASAWNDRLSRPSSMKSAAAWLSCWLCGVILVTATIRDTSGYGRSRKRTAWTTANMALLAAIPNARVRIAIAANPGLRPSHRMAKRRSSNVVITLAPPIRELRAASTRVVTRAPAGGLERRSRTGARAAVRIRDARSRC